MSKKTARWSAPGSLLIAGEYIVTETDGPGIALALNNRATLRSDKSDNLRLEGIGPLTAELWTPSSGDDGSLIFAVFDECRISYSAVENLSVKLSVDTNEFYDRMGGKLGYGSSAAAAVLFTRGLLNTENTRELSSTALKAHRRWQKGRGSGYDILTSAYGGAGFFLGGKNPEWTPLQWPSELKYWLIKGPEPVNSSIAVKKYKQWLREQKVEWNSIPVLSGIKSEMKTIQDALNQAAESDPSAILETINRMAEYGTQLGRAIDVPAIPILPEGFPKDSAPWYRTGAAAAKCLGAGDEITLLAALPDGLTRDENRNLAILARNGKAQELRIDPVGLIQEYRH